jgi:hypothetical protein
MKRIILALVAISLIGCGRKLATSPDVTPSLSAPSAIVIGSTIQWNKVQGASTYVCTVKWHVQYVGDDSIYQVNADTLVNIIGVKRPASCYLYACNPTTHEKSPTTILILN